MTTVSDESSRPSTLADYLDVVRRRKWLFLPVALLVPLVAVLLSMRGAQMYEASAQAVLKRQELTRLSGAYAPYVDPVRAVETEAGLARLPVVAHRALARVPESGLTKLQLMKSSSVSTSFGSDLLTFTVRDSRPRIATLLATAYAQAFAAYRRDLDQGGIIRAQQEVKRELEDLEVAGLEESALYRSLVQKQKQIVAIQSLHTPGPVQVVRYAQRATKVGSTTIRNALLGITLGVLLALGLVFLVEALDSRVRSVDTIRKALGLRLLGKLPTPSRDRSDDGLVMIVDPRSGEAEGFRILRAGLDFANAELGARTIVLTSALDSEGKSTTVANLAVAMARAGRHVILADFDLRNPSLHRFFDLSKRPGVIDVQLGEVGLENALQQVSLGDDDVVSLDGRWGRRPRGRLEVLPAGQALDDSDNLGVAQAIANVVETLRSRGDVVLIDSPPLLPTGDTLALMAHVDAVVLVVRQYTISASALRDVGDVLASVPAAKLGFVLTGAAEHEVYSSYRYPGSSATEPVERSPSAGMRAPASGSSAATDQLASYPQTKTVGLDE